MLNIFKRLVREEEGQGMVEYGLILAFISVIAVVAIREIGPLVKAFFVNAESELD